jgi:hypothetical protein
MTKLHDCLYLHQMKKIVMNRFNVSNFLFDFLKITIIILFVKIIKIHQFFLIFKDFLIVLEDNSNRKMN